LNFSKTWVARLLIAGFAAVAIASVAVAVYAAILFRSLPDASELADYRPPTATRVFAWDGTLIGEFSRERRVFVGYDQIPPRLAQAFLAAEDKNFFQHGGVDYNGLSRAMIKNVANLINGRRLEGGSTITQQVAKNVLLNSDVTVGRKVKEAILASRLESSLSKQRILELYLNEIWLGYRSFGVAAASYSYFGKSLNELTLAECAYLASLPKGPDNYHPKRHHKQAIDRRNWVLGEMESMGWISHAEAVQAKAEPLVVQDVPIRTRYKDADYFLEAVRRSALDHLGRSADEKGYYLRTTLDSNLQTAARIALMKGLEAYDHRHGWRGAWGTVTVAPGWAKAALKISRPAERKTWEAAVVERAEGSRVDILTASTEQRGVLAVEDVFWASNGPGLKVGDLIFVEKTSGGAWRLRQVPNVNGALVAMDPWTGRVVALVGGYSYSLSNFNRATQAARQPGSSFKPFVYATALENGYTPASKVVDSALKLRGRDGEDWSPENYHKRFYGSQYLRRGLELSINAMTVRLAQNVGMKKIRDTAKAFGVVDDMPLVLSTALGSAETTPIRLTGAYAPFVNGGYRVEPHMIELAQDREGKVVYRADSRICGSCRAAFTDAESPRLSKPGPQVIDPITAYQIASMLQGVVQRGTAAQVSSLGYPLGGKTGTTNEYRSAWFVGFSRDLVVGVYVGFDDNHSLGEGETGAVDSVPIFMDFMSVDFSGRPGRSLPARHRA